MDTPQQHFKATEREVDLYIDKMLKSKDPFFHTDLGAKAFKAVVKKANAYQRHQMLRLMLEDPEFFLPNSKAFEFVCSKY